MNRTIAAACLLALAAAPAAAQSIEELKRMIAERDATIADLRRRLAGTAPPVAVAPPAVPASAGTDPADEEGQRALERALVQQGALVMRANSFEIEPALSYATWDPGRAGGLRNGYSAGVALRMGLPWNSQVQLSVPYSRIETTTGNASGRGDFDVTFSRELMRGRDGYPALLGSIGWSDGGGDPAPGAPATSSGFRSVHASLTGVTKRDPLVFFGSVSYSTASSRTIAGVVVDPGNAFGLRLGGVLAASPDTSLSLGLNLGFPRLSSVGGIKVPDSDATTGTLQLGVGTVLSRNTLLNVTGDIRLTGNVPNLRLSVSLPVRF